MSKLVTDVVGDILADAPGCPRTTIVDHLRRAVAQMCRDTLAYDQEIDRFALNRDVKEITPAVPQHTRVVVITKVELTVSGIDDPIPLAHQWDGDIITLPDAPRENDGTVRIHAALEPEAGRDEIPAAVRPYTDTICDYARSRLFMQPRQAWSDPNLASVYRGQYEHRVTDILVRKAKRNTTTPLRTKPQPFI